MPNQRKQKPDDGEEPQGPDSLYAAQKRRTMAQAKQEELKLAELEGSLIRRDVVDKLMFKLARETRDKLQNVGARLGGPTAACSDPVQCAALIDKEIQQCLEGLAGEEVDA